MMKLHINDNIKNNCKELFYKCSIDMKLDCDNPCWEYEVIEEE